MEFFITSEIEEHISEIDLKRRRGFRETIFKTERVREKRSLKKYWRFLLRFSRTQNIEVDLLIFLVVMGGFFSVLRVPCHV